MDWPPSDAQRSRDVQHLNLLAIFHYIYGGLVAVTGCASLIVLPVFGLAIFADPTLVEEDEAAARAVGTIMFILGGCGIVFSLAIGGLVIYAGTCLSHHRNYILCMIVAALMCLSIPLGTILGVFTIVVLARPTVKPLFDSRPSSPPPVGA